MSHTKRVHITTMCKKNDVTKRHLVFGMSFCDKGFYNREFNMIEMSKESLHGKASKPITNTDFYLVMYDPDKKSDKSRRIGTAFQNGKIYKEYSIEINGMHQHHYIIEYIGKYVDNAQICI